MVHLLLPLVLAAVFPLCVNAASANCLALQKRLHLENTTIINVTYVAAPTNVTTPGSCQSSAPVTSAPLCRVQFVINTTTTSAVHAEAWLPDTWCGRFMGLGNGGLGGCVDYNALDYGTSLHFAAVGSDNGHDGSSGLPFLNHPEVINDFAFRAIHVEAVIGKQIVEAYYGRTAAKSYYLGHTSGPEVPRNFDGILAGAPATDFNHLQGGSGFLSHYVGARSLNPADDTSPKFLSAAEWSIVSAEILKQCDTLDGVLDGIITEPDECDFRPEAIQCAGNATADCLTPTRLKQPTPSPGLYSADWERCTILNVTEHDFSNFSLHDIALFDKINPGGIATFDGDMSAFRARGGKFLTYHGRRDPVPGYDLISHTMSLPLLDDFYRLFLIPGMGHCSGGLGPTSFGQGTAPGSNVVNASSHNILLALVDWVEGGIAPATIIGSAANGNGTQRTHCRYPMRSVFNGTAFVCVK
ncbi:tannase and feruloyl esterase [Mycena leptocephala]|nr:tannase and feruloyl esterase [Mycena leptocephala]